MSPIPFSLEISQADIEDLKTRLVRTRLPDQAPDAPWDLWERPRLYAGFNLMVP